MKTVYAAALFTLAAGPAFAQAHPNALVEFPAKSGAKLTVTSPAFQNNATSRLRTPNIAATPSPASPGRPVPRAPNPMP
jgi:hypothetical protein